MRQSGKLLHVVPRLHFVDSPEWFGVAADDLFQVDTRQVDASITYIAIFSSTDFCYGIRRDKNISLAQGQTKTDIDGETLFTYSI